MRGGGSELTVSSAEVGSHYDDLDVPYREIWGEHVHHGYWTKGGQSPQDAARALVTLVADLAGIQEGERVVDVGCGYGAAARMLARTRGAVVTGYTVSKVQFIRASHEKWDESSSMAPLPRIVLGDWLSNDLPSASQDVVLAIESVEHMSDRERFFDEAARVLRPGGRLIVAAWLSKERPFFVTRRLLLEPIVRDGRLASLPTLREHEASFARTGFVGFTVKDVTRSVRRTWGACLARSFRRSLADPSFFRRYVLGSKEGRAFVPTMMRIALAYRIGTMRYAVLLGRKPGGEGTAAAG